MALINLRNALMAGKRLPYDAEVEYLESTGTQWIDTGVSISDASLADVTWNVEVMSYNNGCMGAYDRGSYTSMYINFYTNKFYMRNMRASGGSFTGVSGFNTVRFSGGNSYLNGTAVETEIPLSIKPVPTMYLFAYNRAGTTSGFCKARVSSFIVKENGVLVRDFIPVRKGTVGYLYDRVSGKLFGNAGTGDFVLGQDVVPVEYIESHGTEYIDTGVAATGATNSEFQFKMSVASFAFGARTAWNASAYSLNYATGKYAFNYGNNGVTAELITNIYVDTNWHTAKIQSGGVLSLDGWTNTVGEYSFTTSGSLILFGTRQGSSINLAASGFKYCKIWESSALVRSFLPVRVGSGSTWGGAMMDVLTRRIYRNAGTGAFTYGNDLKYPIPAA